MRGTPSLTRNVTSNWVGMAMGIAYALIITPIVVKALDARLYGAWSFLNGLLAYSELFYLGLGSAVIRYVAQARAADDRARINRLGSVVFSIYSAIGLLCVVITLGLSTRIPSLFADSLSPEVSRAVSITCILLGVRLLATFVSSAFTGLMCGHDRFDLINAVGMASGVIRFVAIPLLLHEAREPLLTLAVLTCVMSLVEAAAMISLAFWYIPGLSVRPTRPQSHELKLLYGFGFQSFLVLIAFKLISYTDTTVIGWRLGLASVALYSIPLQLVEYARMIVGGFSGVLLPRLTLLSTQQDLHQLREAYLSSARLGCFLAGWIGALVIALGPPFLARWVGLDYAAASHMVLVWLTVASFAQALSTQVPYPFYQALGLLAVPAAVLTLEGVTNLTLSLWLAPKMGIEGVALATAIPAILVSLVVLPPYLCRRLNVPLRTLAIRSVLPGVLMLGATLTAESLLANIIVADSYAQIAILAALSLPVALLVFGVTFPSAERQVMWSLLRFRSGDTL